MQPPRGVAPRSRVPWALAVTVGVCSGLAGYVIHAALVRRAPKQVVTAQRLTSMAGPEEEPTLSPDGKMVAFVAESGGRRQVWTRSIGGGAAPEVLTKDDADHSGPRWAPDSRRLIYFASGAIWEIPATGGVARRLADAVGPGDLSQDGNKLAFFRSQAGGVELMAGTATLVKLGSGAYSNLRWSPDDKKIAYLDGGSVKVVSVSGGAPVRAAPGIQVQGFAWTPDHSGLIVSTRGELWFFPRSDRDLPRQLTFGELSYESPDVDAAGNVVVSRRGLAGQDADIVLFSGLRW